MNHLLYDLGVANIPKDIGSMFTNNKTNRARWGALMTLIGVAIAVNQVYKKLGLREPYSLDAAVPSVAGLTPGRYNDIGPVRIVKDIGSAVASKERKTREKAKTRILTSMVPGGAQISRFMQGNVFPEKNKGKKIIKIRD